MSKETEEIYAEVRSDFYDDDESCTCIDAWRTSNGAEEGEVVAKVYDDGRVEYLSEEARRSTLVKEEIEAVIEDLKDNGVPEETER